MLRNLFVKIIIKKWTNEEERETGRAVRSKSKTSAHGTVYVLLEGDKETDTTT